MKPSRARRKCLNCNAFFFPNPRAAERQRYCLKPECRQARRRALMRAWLAKPENQDYFRDAENAERARTWQHDHPGYWKNTTRSQRRTLQNGCAEQTPVIQEVTSETAPRTLPDACALQLPLVVGLIAMFTGSTLPNEIATSTRRLVSKGQAILGMVPGMDLAKFLYDQTCSQTGATPESSTSVQLARSPLGAGGLLPPL